MDKWTVQWREYLEFTGVREAINRYKMTRKSNMKKEYLSGYVVEDDIAKIISDDERLTVKNLPPQMDVGFGADLQVSYEHEDMNYSMHVDVTASERKADQVEFFSVAGDMVDSFNDAFCYETEYFNVRFGIKKRHHSFFFYEKPVVILFIEGYKPTTGLLVAHIHNIASILISLNSALYSKGYGARASQKVRPNPSRYQAEYKQYRESKWNK